MVKQSVTREITFTLEELKERLGIPSEHDVYDIQMWVDHVGMGDIKQYRFPYKQRLNHGNGH